MCKCVHRLLKKQLEIADLTLTSQNASERGYRYVTDIPNLYKTLNDILELATKKGYKIGSPNKKKSKNYYGLYSKR